MISEKFENLIVKFLCGAITQKELEELEQWMAEEENQRIFQEYVRVNYALILGANDPDSSVIRAKLLEKIHGNQKPHSKRYTFALFLKYAALVILTLGLCYFLERELTNPSNTTAIVPEREAITLELETGEVVVIPENGSTRITTSNGTIIGRQQGQQLTYDQKPPGNQLQYNTLHVPFGRRFNLTLSDGTKVFLNAGSSLRYPREFLPGRSREVSLEGEAYFDVTHHQMPFEVLSTPVKVRVYGTQFNVSNYQEDPDTEVVLLKGSVGLSASQNNEENQMVVLKPGYKGAFNKSEHLIHTQRVDTTLFTSWIRGDMVFRNTSFENILKKLERQYNVTIVNNNTSLAKEHFNAIIATKDESIEQVLSYFKTLHDIQYSIDENKIVIN